MTCKGPPGPQEQSSRVYLRRWVCNPQPLGFCIRLPYLQRLTLILVWAREAQPLNTPLAILVPSPGRGFVL